MRHFSYRLRKQYTDSECFQARNGLSEICAEGFSVFFPKFPTTAMEVTFHIASDKPANIPHDRIKQVSAMVDNDTGWRVPHITVKPRAYERDETPFDSWWSPFSSSISHRRDMRHELGNEWMQGWISRRLGGKAKTREAMNGKRFWIWYEVHRYDEEARYAHPW